MDIKLTVNGFTDLVTFPDEEISEIHLPILKYIHTLTSSADKRLVVFFAAPPGAGKSTMAAFWEWLCQQNSKLKPIQALSIDGFHYPNSYLLQHNITRNGQMIPLKSIKGAPETYDVHALCTSVRQLKQSLESWPIYDRNIHDPIPDAITVTAPIVIIEGNWLLLDEPNWRCLRGLADISIFLEADKTLVKDRLIRRKLRGGYPLLEVEAHYERSDKPNIGRVMSQRLPADIVLAFDSHNQGNLTWVQRPTI